VAAVNRQFRQDEKAPLRGSAESSSRQTRAVPVSTGSRGPDNIRSIRVAPREKPLVPVSFYRDGRFNVYKLKNLVFITKEERIKCRINNT
jgi:hypothetical protein